MKTVASKTDTWIKKYLRPPDMKTLKDWALQTDPNIKSAEVKQILKKFRNSLPIVSSRMPDGRATSSRSSKLPRSFRSIAWVASDLGISN